MAISFAWPTEKALYPMTVCNGTDIYPLSIGLKMLSSNEDSKRFIVLANDNWDQRYGIIWVSNTFDSNGHTIKDN